MTRLVLEQVVRRYRREDHGLTEALHVPRLELAPGERVAVLGANGSGKSTLLETLAFLARPEAGTVRLDGRDVWAEGGALAARRRCALLLQKTALFDGTVLENVGYGLRARGLSRPAAEARSEATLRALGLEPLARRRRRELSGGEQRRVAVARVLVLEPECLLLDEPCTHADEASAGLIVAAIAETCARTQAMLVLATHQEEQARALTRRVLRLKAGSIASDTRLA